MELHEPEAQGSVATDFLRREFIIFSRGVKSMAVIVQIAPLFSLRELLDFASRSNDMPMRHDQVNVGEPCQIISS